MPLQRVDRRHFLRCQRLEIDPDLRLLDRSSSPFDILVELSEFAEKIAGVELSSWDVSLDLVPTIFSDNLLENAALSNTDALRQNNLLDVRFQDIPLTTTVDLTIEMQGTGYGSAEAMGESVVAYITDAMDTEDTSPFTTGDGCVVSYTVTNGKLSFGAEIGGAANTVNLQFLFGSGPSSGSSPYRAMGFATETNTPIITSPGPIRGPVAGLVPYLSPLRSIDVTVDQMPELQPIKRLPVADNGYFKLKFEKRRFLLLTNPLRNTQELRVRLLYPTGVSPPETSNRGYDLSLDLLEVEPQERVPEWVKQVLQV